MAEVREEQLRVIKFLHRQDDSYIGFVRKPRETDPLESKWKMPQVGSVKVSELEEGLERIQSHVGVDAYFTINGYYRPGFGTIGFTGQICRC